MPSRESIRRRRVLSSSPPSSWVWELLTGRGLNKAWFNKDVVRDAQGKRVVSEVVLREVVFKKGKAPPVLFSESH